jgi:hypothetical protein
MRYPIQTPGRRSIVQILCLALAAGSVAAQHAPVDLLPGRFKAHWHTPDTASLFVPFILRSCEWDGQELKYQGVRSPSRHGATNEIRSIRPSAAAWKEFWKSSEELTLWNWQNYPARTNARQLGDWSLVIEWKDKKVVSNGTNSYPNMLDAGKASDHPAMLHRLWYALDRLVSRPVEVEGEYFAGFEASRLSPSTKGYQGQSWWVETNKDFNDRYSKLWPRTSSDFRFAGPEVSTRLRGRPVGPGRYGHLDQYDHEFIVEEVLELKTLRALQSK